MEINVNTVKYDLPKIQAINVHQINNTRSIRRVHYLHNTHFSFQYWNNVSNLFITSCLLFLNEPQGFNVRREFHSWSSMSIQSSASGFSRYAFLSDHLTDLYTGKSKKKFVKNCPQSGLNPGPLDHHSNALLTARSFDCVQWSWPQVLLSVYISI